jgi:hypothetical protein
LHTSLDRIQHKHTQCELQNIQDKTEEKGK